MHVQLLINEYKPLVEEIIPRNYHPLKDPVWPNHGIDNIVNSSWQIMGTKKGRKYNMAYKYMQLYAYFI